MKAQFNPDWYADSFSSGRNLFWYFERARAGDQKAAQRALELIVGDLTPEGQKQNGGQLHPEIAALLHELLSPCARGKESPVLKTAVHGPNHRPPDDARASRYWWACVEMHRLLAADSKLTKAAAAVAVLAGEDWCEPDSLTRRYRSYRAAISAYLDANQSEA